MALSPDGTWVDGAWEGEDGGDSPGLTPYAFEPRLAEFVDEAFERCGQDPAKLDMRHLRSARRSLGLMFTEWDVRFLIKLWAVDEQPQALTAGDPNYTAASGTLAILDMTVRRAGVHTPVMPMSRSEYAAIPSKSDEGLPTRFYYERIITPKFTLWQVPENSTDVIHYWRVRRLQDVGDPSNGLDVTSRWFEPVAAGLAAKLALKFAPARLAKLEILAERAFEIARVEEHERGDTRFAIG